MAFSTGSKPGEQLNEPPCGACRMTQFRQSLVLCTILLTAQLLCSRALATGGNVGRATTPGLTATPESPTSLPNVDTVKLPFPLAATQTLTCTPSGGTRLWREPWARPFAWSAMGRSSLAKVPSLRGAISCWGRSRRFRQTWIWRQPTIEEGCLRPGLPVGGSLAHQLVPFGRPDRALNGDVTR